MTTVAIMQPTYLGWCGFFDMLDQADVFVIDDLAAVNRKSWQTRNRIRARDGKVIWLSVPTNARQGMALRDVEIASDDGWTAKHSRAIRSAYDHAPHFAEVALTAAGFKSLAVLNEFWIRLLADRLGIKTRIVRASSLARLRHGRIPRLADMLQSVDATEMLDTAGARDVLGVESIGGVPIRWHAYEHPVYDQGGAEFASHLSVVDLIAWHGPRALEIIRSGRV